MKIYNTLAKRVEEIITQEPQKLKMYSCGPTVYRYIHIGNLRTFTMADWIRRTFEYRGYTVLHVKNITDVGHVRQEVLDQGEDKLIAQARKEGKTSAQIAQFYTAAFHEDETILNVLPAHIFPRATQHIPEMITIIQGLLAKEIAYTVNGYVYYDIKRFPGYGKLSGNQLAHMQAGTHEGTHSDRHNPEDFPLWKPAEPDREMAWESPWGRGFPGWHIECSAMSMRYLGTRFDLHTGGVDNIFPHHEDEIAQSEGFSGQPYVNYWVHAQHLLADGQKMAKSTGNAYTRAEIEARGFDPIALRYFYTTALYRSRLNFTFRALQAAQTALERLRDRAYTLYMQADKAHLDEYELQGRPDTQSWRDAFLAEVENDLNMPRAMAVVWAMLRTEELDATAKIAVLLDIDRILGFDLKNYLQSSKPREKSDPLHYLTALPVNVVQQVQARATMRQQAQYEPADLARQEVSATGYAIRDTIAGPLVLPRRPDDEFIVISSSNDTPDQVQASDLYTFSVNLLAHNNRADLERCIMSICQYAGKQTIEIQIIDNGSTDDTLAYLQQLARQNALTAALGQHIALQVLFADHNIGFAAGRNATMRASRGHIILLLDTSIEITGDIWQPLVQMLSDETIGVVGPYGLVTEDLREFSESPGPDVDAIEGYMLAFRRTLLPEVGWIDEKFRFYRLMDVYFSFFFKTAGYRAVAVPGLEECILKHPHREWFSLNEDERATKSKKNYDIFRARWHHGESLLVKNLQEQNRWRGHDHSHHLEGTHTHPIAELPPPNVMHTHTHRHWPDHSHEHPHHHQH